MAFDLLVKYEVHDAENWGMLWNTLDHENGSDAEFNTKALNEFTKRSSQWTGTASETAAALI